MKNLRTIFLNRILALVLTIVALMTGQEAWAESNWTVQYTSHDDQTNVTTFTVTRKDKTYAQTVRYRTVGLSAYAGQHFNATDGFVSFDAGEDKKTVTVTERTPDANKPVYKYQNGSTERKYKLEVTDRAGYLLAGCTRTMTNGTSFSADKVSKSITNLVYFNGTSYASDVNGKYVDVSYTPSTDLVETSGTLNGYVYIDDSYDYEKKSATVSTSTLISTTGASAAYLNNMGYKIYATVCFTEKEKDDGYQYIQIIGGIGSAAYDGADPEGAVNAPVNSLYKVCFELSDGNNAEGKAYFPHRGTTASEFSLTTGKLWEQKFKSDDYNGSGAIVLAPTISYITTRFDAGGNDNDSWGYKDFFVRMALVDATAPTKLAVSVAPGRHSKGNTVYVSVAFSEIVTVSGTPTLTTTTDNKWGNLTYVAGSGTNVLTFKGTIPQDATGDLNITGFSGTIQDLAGNNLSGGVTASSICTLDNDFAYAIDDFQKDGDNYLIKTHEDLIGLAGYVNGGGATKGKTFLQVADIAFAHTTNWNNANSTENNYTAIGTNKNPFLGTFDGQGYTVSGIRIYRGGTSNSDFQGLFGSVKSGGTVKRVTLSDARITGYCYVGGIVGRTYYSSIEDCIVDANVCIHAVQSNTYDHGGIVGYNQAGPVKRCISRATLTVANSSGCKDFGGIVGLNTSNIITDCIAEGVVIPDVNARGAIVGFKNDFYGSTLTRNYYHDCKVASNSVTHSGVGMGTADSKTASDVDGAQPLWAVTLPTHASVVRTPATDPLPGTNNMTYDNGADINGVPYAKGASVVNLSYDPATITEGYDVLLSVNQTSDNTAVTFTDNGDYTYRISMMPTADITVSATEIPVIAYIDADGNPQSHACTPIVEGTTSYQTLGRTEGWYVVNSDVTISGTQGVKFLDKAVHIVLCDGATLTSNATTNDFNGINANNGSLTIYAQSGGTGRIVATARDISAINAKLDLDINGGIISATTEGAIGIHAANMKSGSITIRRGSVTAQATTRGITANNNLTILGGTVSVTATRTDAGSGLSAYYGDVSIFGGNVTANGYNGIEAGIANPTSITLGYTTVDDRITASSYACATLTIADGQILSDGTDTYSGTLTNDQKTAIAGKTLSTAIPYIDADGTTKYKASKDLTFITTSKRTYGNAANTEGWYCVNSDVNFTDIVTFNDQQVNIILCDGATMSGEKYLNLSYSVIAVNNGSLAIYGQTHGTGTLSLNCTAGGSAIFANSNIDINGGTINASSSDGIGIKANNAITIRRGNITTKGGAYGFSASTVTLGCATTADRIYSTGYKGTVTIADGQTLTDGYSANTYANTLTDEQKNAIKKKTMMKALGDVSYIDENGQEQICNNYKILSDGILTATLHSIGKTFQDTWYVASGNYTFNATYLETSGHVHIILCDGASFTVNGSGSYGIKALNNLSIYGQSQDTGTLTVNVADEKGRALYVDYGNLVVNGGVVSAHGGEYGIYINNGKLTVNGGSIKCSDNKGLYVNGDALMGSPLLAHHMPQYDIKGLLSVKLTMNSIGIMTYSGVNSLDFTNVSGLSAYVALSDADSNGNITLTRTYKPEGLTGMVLCGEPSTSYIVPTVKDKDPDVYHNNLLRHVIVATEIDKTDGIFTNYILAKKNGNVGFYPLSGKGTLKPYSAYLQLHIDPIKSRGLVLNFEEETTSLREKGIVKSEEFATAAEWYTLDGVKLSEKPTKKGLYIHGGKKVVIK